MRNLLTHLANLYLFFCLGKGRGGGGDVGFGEGGLTKVQVGKSFGSER